MSEKKTSEQYIITHYGEEDYGISIKYIQSIIRMQKITRIPKAPTYIKGVINLRGKIIPVMSFCDRLKLNKTEFTNKTRIVIIEIDDYSMGLIVDDVKEVVMVNSDQIEKVVSSTNTDDLGFIYGVANFQDKLISLLNLKNIMQIDEH